MDALGDRLIEIIVGARQECLFVAPYIKLATLSRLLECVDESCVIRVVTRWRLDEISIGVSDIEIWTRLNQRQNSELWLHPSLHAKYYRADDVVALGSANLTDAALGWKPKPNLEILQSMGKTYSNRERFERALFDDAVMVDRTLYDSFISALEEFPNPKVDFKSATFSHLNICEWRPTLRHPETLYELYVGNDDVLTQAAREAAGSDLAYLDPPPMLSKAQFNSWVRMALLQNSEFTAIDRFVLSSRRFGEMRDFFVLRGAKEGTRAWQTWMRWILHFLPDRLTFHTVNYSEIVSRPHRRNEI